MASCIFCKIVSGDAPSVVVFEDDDVVFVAPLPDSILACGHILAIPKDHFMSLFDIDEIALSRLFSSIQRVCLKLRGSLGASGDECVSGFCTDGVCCEDLCAGECMACNASGSLGYCTPIPSGTDPGDECGSVSCGGGSGSSFYWGWDGVSCYFRDDLGDSSCSGLGRCENEFDLCPFQSVGGLAASCDCLSGCSGCFGVTLGNGSSSLVGYYRFDGDAVDEVSGVSGTVSGAVLSVDRFGVVNRSFSFDNGEVVNSSLGVVLRSPSELSVCAWVSNGAAEDWDTVVARGHEGLEQTLWLGYRGGKVMFELGNGTHHNNFLGSVWSPSGGRWDFVCGVANSSHVGTCLNGSCTFSEWVHGGFFDTYVDDSMELSFGKSSYTDNYYWSGSIDDVMFFDRMLSASEVSNLSASGRDVECLNGECVDGLDYDEDGNLVSDGEFYYVFDGFNRLTEVRDGVAEGELLARYWYDESGQRIKKEVYSAGLTETTYYLGDFVRVVNSSGTFEEVFVRDDGGVLRAKKGDSGEVTFYHPDHLGSTRVVSNESGVEVERLSYMPFGADLVE